METYFQWNGREFEGLGWGEENQTTNFYILSHNLENIENFQKMLINTH